MLLTTEVNKEFLTLFYHDIVDHNLENQNRLNLFILRIENNRFTYEYLIEELYDIIITYSLSKKQLQKYKDSKGGKTFVAAKEKFRKYSSNDGELGEMLLYCFLESYLGAPKILTKLEIKTSSNDYVKGADGVHFLKLDDTNFQLIFGESKLNSDLGTGIREAFHSIIKFLDENGNKVGFEIKLVDSELIKESVDEETYQILKKIIVPNANEDTYNLYKSFGIFLGFDIEIEEEDKKLDNNTFRQNLRKSTKKKIMDSIKSIEYQIKKNNLWGYNFYIYIVPFTELKTQRKKILETIMG